MTDLTLFSGGNTKISMKNRKEAAQALKDTAADASQGSLPDGGVYISFSGKAGRYSIGEKKEDANPEELWIVNVGAFERGWICWKGGSPAARRMQSIYEPVNEEPDFSEHGPFDSSRGEGWFVARGMTVRSVDTGVQGYFSTNTVSSVKVFAALQNAVAERIEEGEPEWPVISLDKEDFTSRGHKNYKPKFEIYGWLGDTQIMKMAQMGSVDKIAEAIDDLIEEAEAEALANVDSTTGLIDDDLDDDMDDMDDALDGDFVDAAFDDEDEDDEPAPAPKPRARRAKADPKPQAGGRRSRRASV